MSNGIASHSTVMEVYFLDVGQGTSQVILLGDRRAIVLDCGAENDSITQQFLQLSGVDFIECLIVSHSHADHAGGALSILTEYQDRIGLVGFVQDHLFLKSALWLRLSQLVSEQVLFSEQLVRLEFRQRPQLVWQDTNVQAKLLTFSPTGGENLQSQTAAQSNPTSAVIFLDVADSRIVFAADSEAQQWKEISRRRGKTTKCNVLAVPHHGGRTNSTTEELEWMFSKGVAAETAVISVGTSNTYGHPRPEVVAAMVSHGIRVLCTQITCRCVSDLEAVRPGVLSPVIHLGRSSSTTEKTSRGNSRHVGCAGTIRVQLSREGLVVDRINEHAAAVTRLHADGAAPLCRS